MDVKPADLFLNIVDILAVILPGAAMLGLACWLSKDLRRGLRSLTGPVWWLAVLVASYTIGQFIGLLSPQLNRVYHVAYRAHFAPEIARREAEVSGLVKAQVGSRPASINALQWAQAYIRLQNPYVSTAIDRVEADAKFLRGICVVLVIALLATGCVPSRNRVRYFVVCLVALSLSLFRFFDLQENREAMVYQHYLLLKTTPSPPH